MNALFTMEKSTFAPIVQWTVAALLPETHEKKKKKKKKKEQSVNSQTQTQL